MPEQKWITVRAPKMLYLPVNASSGEFKDSGRRVEPTDLIELLLGTNRIRINGMDLTLAIPCDNIPVQNGVIALARPKPPVRLSTQGAGWAVGRPGEAQSNARRGWDQQAAANWRGDAGTDAFPPHAERIARGGQSNFPVIQSHMDAAQPIVSFNHDPAFDSAITRQFGLGKADDDFNPSDDEVADAFADPNIEIREISLKGGATAYARFDKRTDKQVGTPFRQYQARYGDGGAQLSAPAPTHGPNATFDMAAYKKALEEEYRQRLAEQNATATIAPTAAERYDLEKVQVAQQVALQAPPEVALEVAPEPTPTTSTGTPHLDNLIAGAQGVTGGFPLGKITHICGDLGLLNNFGFGRGTRTRCGNITSAFGRIHLLKPGQEIVYIAMGDTSPAGPPRDNLRLGLAEELPVLVEMIKNHRVAVVILTPDWDEATTPALLRFLPVLRIRIVESNQRKYFVTATITKDREDTQGRTATFPNPL